MRLPSAPATYDQADQADVRGEVLQADGLNIKRNGAEQYLLLQAPNGTVYKLSVSNAGAAVFTAY